MNHASLNNIDLEEPWPSNGLIEKAGTVGASPGGLNEQKDIVNVSTSGAGGSITCDPLTLHQ